MGLTSIGNWVNLLIVNADFPSTGVIFLQVLTGLVGSLIASAFIAIVSEKRFNRAVKKSEDNITAVLNPINSMVSGIAHNIQRLAGITPALSTIGNEIKTLAAVVDKIRKGLEKTK